MKYSDRDISARVSISEISTHLCGNSCPRIRRKYVAIDKELFEAVLLRGIKIFLQ
jgi:hypothetical protein